MTTDTTRLTDAQWLDIDRQAERSCVVFTGHRLPPGCTPTAGRIGIEPAGEGSRTLLVERGLRYAGQDAGVATWLSSGSRTFPGILELRRWLAAVLSPAAPVPADGGPEGGAPSGAPPAGPALSGRRGRRAADELVDLRQVQAPAPRRARVDAAELAALLRRQVAGQDLAVEQVAVHVARHVAKSAPRRPMTMLVSGPTGVGKTLMAGVLAEALGEVTGDPWPLLRIDGNEFTEPHTVARLVGAPPGYRGHGEGGDLASTLAAAPRSVVLIDEVDKAHPDVLRVLMNLMDAGRLGRGSGPAGCDARPAVLIFTSNAVTDGRGASDLGGTGDRPSLVAQRVSPEIAARITTLVSFAPLGLEGRARVAVLAVSRVAESYGVELTSVDPALVSRLLRADVDEGFGARTLEYLVERELGEAFATASADGDVVAAIEDGVPPVLRLVVDPTDPQRTT
jgi:hypothetical protein